MYNHYKLNLGRSDSGSRDASPSHHIKTCAEKPEILHFDVLAFPYNDFYIDFIQTMNRQQINIRLFQPYHQVTAILVPRISENWLHQCVKVFEVIDIIIFYQLLDDLLQIELNTFQ